MKTVSVIPLKKGIFKDNLTYFSTKDVLPGDIVTVLVRGKKILGLVTESEETSQSKSEIKRLSFGLKKINEVKEHSIFRHEFFESAIILSSYFAGSKSNIISSLIPSATREDYDKISKVNNLSFPENNIPEKNKLNIKPEKLLFQTSFEERISYYKTLIRESFAGKKSIFIVLPTEHDVKIFYESLHRGIENFIIPIHGGLNAKKQVEKFIQVLS